MHGKVGARREIRGNKKYRKYFQEDRPGDTSGQQKQEQSRPGSSGRGVVTLLKMNSVTL